MTQQEKQVEVTVTATRDSKGEIHFDLESTFSNGGMLTFKNKKKGDTYRVLFNLEDGGLGLTFKPSPDDALWVRKGGPCPTKQSKDKQFEAKRVSKDGKTLEVKNKNENAALYYYTLRFDSPDGDVEWDPIISNQNGGEALYAPALLGCVGAVAAAALAAIGLKRLGTSKGKDSR